MCSLKSDDKSWATYKVFNYNFYIGSAKKKIINLRKKEKHFLHQHGLVILSPFCRPEIQSKQFTYKARPFCCVWI